MVLRMCIHSNNMAGISEGIDLRNYSGGLSSLLKKERIAIRFILFSDEKVETFVLELWQPFFFMKQDTDKDII